MKTQQALLQEIRADHEAKLAGLRAYIRELTERADAHDAEDDHYEDDLMRARHDAAYYEAELRQMGANPPRAVPPPPPLGGGAREAALPVGMLVGAAAVGAFLGHLLTPRRW